MVFRCVFLVLLLHSAQIYQKKEPVLSEQALVSLYITLTQILPTPVVFRQIIVIVHVHCHFHNAIIAKLTELLFRSSDKFDRSPIITFRSTCFTYT